MKKIVAIAVVLSMLLAFSLPAMAASGSSCGNGSSCVNGKVSGSSCSGSSCSNGNAYGFSNQTIQSILAMLQQRMAGQQSCYPTTSSNCKTQCPTATAAPVTPSNPQTPTPQPENPTTDPLQGLDKNIAEVVRLVNVERKNAGLNELAIDQKAAAAAQVRAKEIVKTFSHTRPNGTSCFTALKEAGVSYRGAGENIAYGQKDAAKVMNAWMNSPGHKANILGKNFTKIGVGCYQENGQLYWSQFFIY